MNHHYPDTTPGPMLFSLCPKLNYAIYIIKAIHLVKIVMYAVLFGELCRGVFMIGWIFRAIMAWMLSEWHARKQAMNLGNAS